MQPMSEQQCGDLLAMWLGKACSPESAKAVAKEAGYNDSPFFGAKKKKIKLTSEIVMLNTALVIFAVNQVFEELQAKSIIDSFLAISNKSIFSVIEKKDSTFSIRYEKRLAKYFKILHEENLGIGISFHFLTYIDIDPLKSMQAQLLISDRFGKSLSQTIDILKSIDIEGRSKKQNPIDLLYEEAQNWPDDQAKTAFQLIQNVLSGEGDVDDLFGELTV